MSGKVKKNSKLGLKIAIKQYLKQIETMKKKKTTTSYFDQILDTEFEREWRVSGPEQYLGISKHYPRNGDLKKWVKHFFLKGAENGKLVTDLRLQKYRSVQRKKREGRRMLRLGEGD